jgi:hypothetical protein
MIDHLVDKGMEVSAISAYIRNLANIITENPHITLQELGEQMRSLGWNDFQLDGYTLRLILANFETDYIELTNCMPTLMQVVDEKAEKNCVDPPYLQRPDP